MTELPGLDDLSYPQGVLRGLERRIASLYNVSESVLSVGGASIPLLASVLATARRGSEILVPRNAHRSIIHALVLSGLNPVWYEPHWDGSWGLWGEVDLESLKSKLRERVEAGKQDRGGASHGTGGGSGIAAVVVVSPTFAGALSDIESAARLAHEHNVPLIVDEAHGAHLLPATIMPASAAACGADLVVHSFHKTLGALTGTGAVHITRNSLVEGQDVRAALALVQTSSPNYILMASVEQAIMAHEGESGRKNLARLAALSTEIRAKAEGMEFYTPEFNCDPLHITLTATGATVSELACALECDGIYVESVLGRGCLLMLGAGSEECDIDLLLTGLSKFHKKSIEKSSISSKKEKGNRDANAAILGRPPALEQVISPRQAFFSAPHTVSLKEAIGKVSADCIAPCPPGMPVVVPGSRVPEEILELESQIAKLRVVADGP